MIFLTAPLHTDKHPTKPRETDRRKDGWQNRCESDIGCCCCNCKSITEIRRQIVMQPDHGRTDTSFLRRRLVTLVSHAIFPPRRSRDQSRVQIQCALRSMIRVTQARESSTRNMHRIERSSIRYKFMG